MRRWIALGVAAVGVAWTPYLYSEWQASRASARQRAEVSDDEVQQPSAASAESQLSAAEDQPPAPKPPAPLPQPVPVAPDPSLQRRGEAVARAIQNAARPSVMPTLTARLPDIVAPAREQQPERSPDAPLTTHAIETAKPPPQAPPPAAPEPAANEPANAEPQPQAEAKAPEHASDQPAQEPANAAEPEAPAQPNNEADKAPAPNDAPEP